MDPDSIGSEDKDLGRPKLAPKSKKGRIVMFENYTSI